MPKVTKTILFYFILLKIFCCILVCISDLVSFSLAQLWIEKYSREKFNLHKYMSPVSQFLIFLLQIYGWI